MFSFSEKEKVQRRFSLVINSQVETHKIILLSGPRNVGKVAFIEEQLGLKKHPFQTIDLGQELIRQQINKLPIQELIWLVNEYAYCIISECEYLLLLPLFMEEILNGKVSSTVILTAVSLPKINDELMEALNYQGVHFYFPPPTFYEYTTATSVSTEIMGIDQRLIYGNYYSLNSDVSFMQEGLNETVKKILPDYFSSGTRINKSEILVRTLQVLAHHIGQPLSFNQVANFIGVDNETVERYVNLLCVSHILYKIPCYTTDKTYELKKTHVFVFLDNGIRNAAINNFNDLSMRIDIDSLWMNWLVAEKIKWNKINNINATYFFWRTHTRQQVDLIECKSDGLEGYKFSYSKKKRFKTPPLFQKYYPHIPVHTVNRSTFLSFISKK